MHMIGVKWGFATPLEAGRRGKGRYAEKAVKILWNVM